MASVDQLPSGLWHVRVRRKGYPAQRKSFARKEDAEAWARRAEGDLDRGQWTDRASGETITLHALLVDYMREVAPLKRGAEVEIIRLRSLQRDPISSYSLLAISPAVVARWRDARLAGGAQGSTVNRELNLVSAVINWGIKERMIALPGNPVASVRRPAAGKARDRRFEPGEEQRLLEALGDRAGEVKGAKRAGAYRVGTRNPWMRPLVQLAIETAMRQGELIALRWENVDLTARTARLPDTKNGEARTVPLSSRAVAVLDGLQRGAESKGGIDGQVFPITAQ
ncbi:phage integrase family protein, partial [mine drainage metagenome]